VSKLVGNDPLAGRRAERNSPMGTIFKRGKSWGINFIDPQGQQVRQMVSSYKETAVKVLKKIETEIVEGRYFDRKEKKQEILFENFAERFFEMYVRLENKDIQRRRNQLNGLIKHFKGKYLSQIDALLIRDYMAYRIKVLKPASVNREYSLLKSMFNRAIEWGIFDGKNPTNSLKKLQENNERCRWLTEDEQETLLSHCQGLTYVVVLTALKTGMRWGEIIRLKWKQENNSNYVDFDNDVIYIHGALSKTNKSRYIPLSPLLKETLLSLPRYVGVSHIFWRPEQSRELRSIRSPFAKALEMAEIKDFKFHDLRHTFASQLVRNKVDLYVVQKLLGHASPKMTQRYAHLKKDQLWEAIQSIDRRENRVTEQSDLLLNINAYN